MTHPEVKLDEAFWFQEGPGVRKWQFTDHGIKLLNVGNILKTGRIDLANTDRHLSADDVQERYSHFLADAGDLVIASSGISIDEDELLRTRGAFIEEQHLPLCMNTSTIRFKAIDGLSDLRFLRHWLQSHEFRVQITREVTGIAQKNFGPSHLKRLHLSLPPLAEQKRIAAILDAADALRAKRRESLAQLDTLLQATFLDMFGDPVTNPKRWTTEKIEQIGQVVTGNTPSRKRPEYFGDYIEWIKSDNINNPSFFLTEAEERLSVAGKKVGRVAPEGSILVTCIAGSPSVIGNAAIANREVAFNQQINAFVPGDRLNHWFAFGVFLVGKRLVQRASTNSMKGMVSKSAFSAISVPVPPRPQQDRFRTIAESIEQQKVNQRAHLDELDTLFASLRSRAFVGDL